MLVKEENYWFWKKKKCVKNKTKQLKKKQKYDNQSWVIISNKHIDLK